MSADPRLLEGLGTLLGWLLTYLVHSTLLLGAAWAVTRGPVRGASAREALWKLALAGALLTTGAQGALGRAPLGGEWRWRAPVQLEVRRDLVRAAGEGGAHAVREIPRVRVTRTLLGAWRAWLAVAWVGGAIGGLALLVAGHRRAMAPLDARDSLAGTHWERVLRRVEARMGVRGRVRLTTSAALTTPAAIGAGEICLPRRVLAEFDAPALEAILAHELAHLERRDPFWLAAARVIERVAFFQPLHVLARRRLQELAEQQADDRAARATGGGRSLAGSLVRVAGWLGPEPAPLRLVAMAEPGGSALVRRVERLLAPAAEPAGSRPHLAVAGGALALAAVTLAAPRVEAGWRPIAAPGEPAMFVARMAAGEVRARAGAMSGRTPETIMLRTTGRATITADGDVLTRRSAGRLGRVVFLATPPEAATR